METVSQDLQQKERRDSDDLDLSTPVGRKRPVFSKESPYSLDDDELELHLETMGKKPKKNDILAKVLSEKRIQRKNLLARQTQPEVKDHDKEDDEEDLQLAEQEKRIENTLRRFETENGSDKLQMHSRSPPPVAVRVIRQSQKRNMNLRLKDTLPSDLSRCAEIKKLKGKATGAAELALCLPLLKQYFRANGCPEKLARKLLRAVYLHEDPAVARLAFQALAFAIRCGSSEECSAGARCTWRSFLHRRAPPAEESAPKAPLELFKDFWEGLTACGVPLEEDGARGLQLPPGGQDDEQSVVDLTVSPVKTSEDEEQLERLALLLHVLAAYCETQKPVELTKIQKILLSLLVLYADNREELYHSALNEAVRAVMEVLPEEGWRPAREYVASRLSCVMTSPLVIVRTLRHIPASSSRGYELQREAAYRAAFVVLQVSLPSKSSGVETRELLCALEPLKNRLTKRARSLTGNTGNDDSEPDFWAIASSLRLADMVLWESAVSSERENLEHWKNVLKTLQRNTHAYSREEGESQLQLLLAELISYYAFLDERKIRL